MRLTSCGFPVDEPDHMFSIMDLECTGEVPLDDFLTACVRLQGDCKSKDLLE